MARRFVVLGGAGVIGRVVVRDLFESNPRNRVVVADVDAARAGLYARRFRSRRVSALGADVRHPRQLAQRLRGAAVVINCTHHELNLRVMQAALAARAHYVDLGGLFVWTRRQLKWDARFRRAGLTAVLGMGCAPGITNLLTQQAAAPLDQVESVKIRVGASEGQKSEVRTQKSEVRMQKAAAGGQRSEVRGQRSATLRGHALTSAATGTTVRQGGHALTSAATGTTVWQGGHALTSAATGRPAADEIRFPYSAQTILEELTLAPWVFRGGRFRQVRPRTGWELVDFGGAVGKQWTIWTRHSEVATLPLSLRAKGVRYCDFKVGFDRAFVREVMKRWRAGWTVRQFAALPVARTHPDDREVARVIVEGVAAGVAVRRTVDLMARAKPRWQATAGDVDTGCPASIVAQMIAAGVISQRGVLAPEAAVPVAAFLAALRRRGMKIAVRMERGNQKTTSFGAVRPVPRNRRVAAASRRCVCVTPIPMQRRDAAATVTRRLG